MTATNTDPTPTPDAPEPHTGDPTATTTTTTTTATAATTAAVTTNGSGSSAPLRAERSTSQWRLIAWREVSTRGRSKVYRATTGFAVLAAIAAVVLAVLLPSGDDTPSTIQVGLVHAPPELAEAIDAATPDGFRLSTTDLDDSEVDAAVEDGSVEVVLVYPADGNAPGAEPIDIELVWKSDPDPLTTSLVLDATNGFEQRRLAEELGVSADDAALLARPITFTPRVLDPPDDGDAARTAVAAMAIIVTFLGVQLYGAQVASVVVEEKAQRIVEILLSLVRPRDLMIGKLVGIGLLGLAQLAILVVGMIAALAARGSLDVPLDAYASLPLLLVTFVGGFGLYGTMFAFAGSLVSRQEDAQQTVLPVMLPMVVGYSLSFGVLADPHSTLATTLTIIPFTAPFTLPVTAALGAAGPWLVAVSLGLLAATTYALFRLTARAYEFTLLRTGTRIKFGEAIRLVIDRPNR